METGSTGERNEGGQSDEPNKAAARQRVRNLTQSLCFRIYRLFACVAQHGLILKLHGCRGDGKARWAYRYRVDGSFSRRPQVGGFETRDEAQRPLRRELARLRPGRETTVTELVEEYLKIHQAAPSTIEKLRWLLSKSAIS